MRGREKTHVADKLRWKRPWRSDLRMAPLESQALEEWEPILGDGQVSIPRETMPKPPQGEDSESPDLLKCLPAPDSSQQPKHTISLRAAAQEQDTAAGTSPLPHSVHCQSASLSLKHPGRWPQGKNPISFWYRHTQETQKGRRITQHALDCRWLLFRPLTPHSPETHVPLLTQSHSWSIQQRSPPVKRVLTFSVQYINGVNFLVTLFN